MPARSAENFLAINYSFTSKLFQPFRQFDFWPFLAVDRAAKEGSLRLHVRVDERVAGFTALGIAKASRRAVAVVTTAVFIPTNNPSSSLV